MVYTCMDLTNYSLFTSVLNWDIWGAASSNRIYPQQAEVTKYYRPWFDVVKKINPYSLPRIQPWLSSYFTEL